MCFFCSFLLQSSIYCRLLICQPEAAAGSHRAVMKRTLENVSQSLWRVQEGARDSDVEDKRARWGRSSSVRLPSGSSSMSLLQMHMYTHTHTRTVPTQVWEQKPIQTQMHTHNHTLPLETAHMYTHGVMLKQRGYKDGDPQGGRGDGKRSIQKCLLSVQTLIYRGGRNGVKDCSAIRGERKIK